MVFVNRYITHTTTGTVGMKKKEEKNEKNNNNNLCLYIMPNVFYFARTDESQCGLDDRVERKRDTNKIVKIHLVMIVTGACM